MVLVKQNQTDLIHLKLLWYDWQTIRYNYCSDYLVFLCSYRITVVNAGTSNFLPFSKIYYEINMNDLYLNTLLFSLLGSHELLESWWTSPNKGFNDKCPKDVPDEEVRNYLERFCFQ